MNKQYHQSLLANIYLAYELYHKSKIGFTLFIHFCKVIGNEIHCCIHKEYDNEYYLSEKCILNKIYQSNQMNEYKMHIEKKVKKHILENNDDITLIADIYLFNLMMYDINDSAMKILKDTICNVHGYELTDECIKSISRSATMMDYKKYLRENRSKIVLKNKLKNPGLIATVHLAQFLAESNPQIVEKILEIIGQIHDIQITPQIVSQIFNSKYMKKYEISIGKK